MAELAHRGRHVDLEAARAQLLVRVADLRGQVRAEVPAGQSGPDRGCGRFDLGGPGRRAEGAQRGVGHLVQARLLPVPPERPDGDGEPLGHADARPEQFGQATHLGAADTDLWVPKTYATRRYSWMTPPARSCRRTRK